MSPLLDPALFDTAAVDPLTRAHLDAALAAQIEWPEDLRERRAFFDAMMAGIAPGGELRRSPDARTVELAGPGGPLELRVIDAPEPEAVLLHCHGGGWTMGTNAQADAPLERLGRRLGVTVANVGYRLAPEHPHPAPVDDCAAAARFVLDHGRDALGSDRLLLSGESAGATLALAALLRLRDGGRTERVLGATLLYGAYDLSMTPSQRAWGTGPGRGAIDTPLLRRFYDAYAPDEERRRDPDISPLYADLRGLPPTLLGVGTHDPLLDDSLFLHARLLAAGVRSELMVLLGGIHGFDLTPEPLPITDRFRERELRFLAGLIT